MEEAAQRKHYPSNNYDYFWTPWSDDEEFFRRLCKQTSAEMYLHLDKACICKRSICLKQENLGRDGSLNGMFTIQILQLLSCYVGIWIGERHGSLNVHKLYCNFIAWWHEHKHNEKSQKRCQIAVKTTNHFVNMFMQTWWSDFRLYQIILISGLG
jgi:hypothetical protein